MENVLLCWASVVQRSSCEIHPCHCTGLWLVHSHCWLCHCHNPSTLPLVDVEFYVQYLAITNIVALNILVSVFCWVFVHVSVERRVLYRRVGVCSSLGKGRCAPTRRGWKLHFSINTGFCFHSSYSGVYAVVSYVVSLMSTDVKLLSISLVTADFHSFMKCRLSLCPLFSAFFVLICRHSLYVLHKSPWLDMFIADIFSSLRYLPVL